MVSAMAMQAVQQWHTDQDLGHVVIHNDMKSVINCSQGTRHKATAQTWQGFLTDA